MAKPSSLPSWIEYVRNPPQAKLVEIYNDASIYLCPSWSEGWNLPATEAMACGCVVVSTDNGGVNDYALHGKTALISPPKDPESLAENLLRVLGDDKLRIKLAQAGHQKNTEIYLEKSHG